MTTYLGIDPGASGGIAVKRKITTLFVPGVPVPKGSARAFYNRKLGRSLVVQTNADKQKPWASMVSLIAQEAGLTPVSDGCRLMITFFMPRPKMHWKANGYLKTAAQNVPHTKKPDLDKLVRCILDALTGVAYADDSQVVAVDAGKVYADSAVVGCEIKVEYVET